MFKVKVRHFLHEMVLDLLHPIFYFPIGDQILRLLKMVPSDYPWPKTLDLSPNSFMFRTKVTISCLQVVLGLLQTLDPVLDLQINLRLLNMVQNDFSYPKTWVNTKIKSLASSEPKLQFHSLKSFLASYSPSTLFLTSRSI